MPAARAWGRQRVCPSPAATCSSSFLPFLRSLSSARGGLSPALAEHWSAARSSPAGPCLGSNSTSSQAISVARSHGKSLAQEARYFFGTLKDIWLLLARSSWLRSRAGSIERPSGSCHLVKGNFKPHQPLLPTVPDPKDISACPSAGRRDGVPPSLPCVGGTMLGWQRVLVTKDLPGRGKPLV